jgi:dienelactone hydrolase
VDAGGVAATLVRAGRRGGLSAVVLVNGATPLGRRHTRIRRLAKGLARAGFAVLVPDLLGMTRGS